MSGLIRFVGDEIIHSPSGNSAARAERVNQRASGAGISEARITKRFKRAGILRETRRARGARFAFGARAFGRARRGVIEGIFRARVTTKRIHPRGVRIRERAETHRYIYINIMNKKTKENYIPFKFIIN